MEFIGYLLAILVGVLLGLIGGGGSILTVPIITYVFGVSATLATTYSLFIVGAAALAGSVSYYKHQQIEIKTALLFGLPTIVGIYLSRGVLIPQLPNELINTSYFTLTKNTLIMVVFATLMLASSLKMILTKTPTANKLESPPSILNIILSGLAVGAITGFVGAGGGFIIVPALVTFFKLSIKRAIGTSLAIITLNSFFGFLIAMGFQEINWPFLLLFSALAIVGIFIGARLSTYINGNQLKPAFGWFVLFMGIFILIKSLGGV